MLDSFLTDFSFIRDTFDKEGDQNFFGKDFSFFSAEPILFYNNATDVIVYANSMFSNEFNYSVEDLAEWKYSIFPLLNKEDQEPFREAMKQLLEGDDTVFFKDSTYRLLGKGKKYSYYRIKVRKLHKSYYYIQLENSMKSAIPVLKNNTADELMQNAESILKFGFWMWDIETDRMYWTKGMYHLLEYDNEEDTENLVLTMTLYRTHVLKDDAYRDFEKKFKVQPTGNFYEVKYQLTTNQGKLLTVSEHGNVEYDANGKAKKIIGITRDITLQEESMKSLADYKAMMLENEKFLNYGTWESDADGDNVFWSEGMYNIFGYDGSDKGLLKINKDLYNTQMLSEDNMEGQQKNIALLMKEDANHYQRNYQIKDNNGIEKILSTYCKIIRDNSRQIKKIIGTTRDVTELKYYERSLENKILELNRSNQELEEFAYVASHDLQEPLRKISTFSQRLQLKFGDTLDEDGNMYIGRMVAGCDTMRKLIDNLLDFSRISLIDQTFEQVDLNVVANQAVDELDLKIAETNSSIIINELPGIEGISSQLLQLFSNIINNSIKFRKENTPLEIVIQSRRLESEEKKEYKLNPLITHYLVSISDNGVGFEQQYAAKIFQVFQRLLGKSEYPGTGIGLSICKKIVTNHKGIIFAESEPDKGATFSIILPQQQ